VTRRAGLAVVRTDAQSADSLQAMLHRCSRETLFQRVLGHSHQAVERLVEDVRTGRPIGRIHYAATAGDRMVAWGCLVPDADDADDGEIALIVEDRWQGRGVGLLVGDAVMGGARQLGVRSVRAIIGPTNARAAGMIRRHAVLLCPPTASRDDIEYRLATGPFLEGSCHRE
jgi:hypothetical protein